MRRYLVFVMKNQKIEGFFTRDFEKVEDFSPKCIHFGEKELYNEIVVKRKSKFEQFDLLVSEYNDVFGSVFHKEAIKNEIAPIPPYDYEFEEKLDKYLQKASYDSPEYDIF